MFVSEAFSLNSHKHQSMDIRTRLGILRSVAVYYWKPFNKRRLMRFYGQFIQPGDLCFDIGAHLGNRTNAWLALGAKVVAVEPQPQCLNYMERKFGQNENVTIYNGAVADKRGELTLHISRATPTISTFSNAKWRQKINDQVDYEVKWEDQILVETVTLDDLIEKYGIPTFCKIDVENFETEVLMGLSQPIPTLSFEYYPPAIANSLRCFNILEDLAEYEYNYSFGESQKFQSDKWLAADAIKGIISGFYLHKHYGDVYARLPR